MKHRIQPFFIKIWEFLLSCISEIVTWTCLRKRHKQFRKPWTLKLSSGLRLCWSPDLTKPDLSAVKLTIYGGGMEIIEAQLSMDSRGDVVVRKICFKGERVVGLERQILLPAPQFNLPDAAWVLTPSAWVLYGFLPRMLSSDIVIKASCEHIPCDDDRILIDMTITADSKILYSDQWHYAVVLGMSTLQPLTIEAKGER